MLVQFNYRRGACVYKKSGVGLLVDWVRSDTLALRGSKLGVTYCIMSKLSAGCFGISSTPREA